MSEVTTEKMQDEEFAKGPYMGFLVASWANNDRSPEKLMEAAEDAREMGAMSDALDLAWMSEYVAGRAPSWDKDAQTKELGWDD